MNIRLKLWIWISILWMIVSVFIHIRENEFPGYVAFLSLLAGTLILAEVLNFRFTKWFKGTRAVQFMLSGMSLAIAGYSFYALNLPVIPHLSVVAGASLFVFGGLHLLRSLDL